MQINIDAMEFIFLFMGYGLGLLDSGYKRGWLILGLMLALMIMQGFYKYSIIIKKENNYKKAKPKKETTERKNLMIMIISGILMFIAAGAATILILSLNITWSLLPLMSIIILSYIYLRASLRKW